jgi:TatD DNase family protein
MVDAHCHLQEFEDIKAEIQKAKDAGVRAIICNGSDAENSKRAIEIANEYSGIWATVGQHPESGFIVESNEFIEMTKHPKVVAIGECGLDYTLETSIDEKAKQKELLLFNIQLAQETKLPLVIHCRNAFDDIFEIVDYVKVQMHCFTGNLEQMQECIKRGWCVSFGVIITFKKSAELR